MHNAPTGSKGTVAEGAQVGDLWRVSQTVDESESESEHLVRQGHDIPRMDDFAHQHYRFVTDDPLTNLANAANAANDLIRAGRLNEAEPLCRRLREDHPEEIDGHQRTAPLTEARGDKKAAAARMREALATALTQDGFEEESYRWLRERISRLETG